MNRPTRTPAVSSRLLVGVVGFVFILAAAGGVLAPNLLVDAVPGSTANSSGFGQLKASPTVRTAGVPSPSPSRVAPTPTPEPTPTPALTPTPAPTPAATPEPKPTPEPTPKLKPRPKPGPFAIDLYAKGDFVSQATKDYCVPASMQTMMNIMDDGANRRPALQDKLYKLARKLSTHRLRGAGAEPEGWARGLNRQGYGPYRVDVAPTRNAAIRRAAKALRMTGRPVGLLVWRGAHSWVMSGFKATADPAYTKDFTVTHVYIQDVWYPRISSIWGASRGPDALIPVDRLREDYLKWRRPTGPYPAKDGRFVLVLPVLPAASG